MNRITNADRQYSTALLLTVILSSCYLSIQNELLPLPFFDSSAINHNVYATIGVQYSEICQLPSPIIGISSSLPPRPFSTAPGNTGTKGRNEEPAKCVGWLYPAPTIVELLNGFDPNIQSNCFCADAFIRSFFKTDAAFKSPIPAEAILELMPTHHSRFRLHEISVPISCNLSVSSGIFIFI